MDVNVIPKHLYLLERKENLDSKPIEHHIKRMQSELSEKFYNLNLDSKLRQIYLFEENYNSISAYAVEIHEECMFEIEPSSEKPETRLIKNEAGFFQRKPMVFFDFEITAIIKQECRNFVRYYDSQEDENIIRSIKEGFNRTENIVQIGRQLISRGIIMNSIKMFCQTHKISNIEFRTTKKKVHFVDSTNAIVYLAINECLERIFGIGKD